MRTQPSAARQNRESGAKPAGFCCAVDPQVGLAPEDRTFSSQVQLRHVGDPPGPAVSAALGVQGRGSHRAAAVQAMATSSTGRRDGQVRL